MTHVLDGAPLPDPSASRNLPVPRSVLAVGAHPDDVEFHAGATIARWAAAGAVVHLVVCTDGGKGSWRPDDDPAAVARVRRTEAADALSTLGGTGDLIHLDVPDGELALATSSPVGPLHEQIVATIRRLTPDVVVGHDPWRRYRLHPDHRAAGWLVVDACVAARDPHFVPHLGPAHRPSSLLLFEADEPNHVEEASDDALGRKVAALLAHRSQWRSTMGIEHDDDLDGRDAFDGGVKRAAKVVGEAASCGPAESFRVLPL